MNKQNNRFDCLSVSDESEFISIKKTISPKKEKKEEFPILLNNSPLLPSSNKIENKKNEQTFLEKITYVKSTEQINVDSSCPEGWITMSIKDKTHPTKIYIIENKKPEINPYRFTKKKYNSHTSVLHILANKYRRYRNEYIKNYGMDEYNNMYICPYHDYHYFERDPEDNRLIYEFEKHAKKTGKFIPYLYDPYRQDFLPYKITENNMTDTYSVDINEDNNDDNNINIINNMNYDDENEIKPLSFG